MRQKLTGLLYREFYEFAALSGAKHGRTHFLEEGGGERSICEKIE